MPHQTGDDAVAAINNYRGALAESMGIVITEATVDSVRASMPVEGNTQPYGLLHGGASAVLAETVGSIAAAIHGGPDHAPVGISLQCTHLKAARSGSVHAACVPVNLGRTLATHRIEIRNDAGDLVCHATLTCLLRRQTAV